MADVPESISIKIDDKPYLSALLKGNQEKGREIIKVFAELMEEAVKNNWHELPQLFRREGELTFKDLVKGILHGALDLEEIDPNAYAVLKEEIHPLSMLSPRKNYLTGETAYADWRRHYNLGNAPINQGTIEKIFRGLLRYYKYLDFEELGKALVNNQIVAFRGNGARNIENLPYYPALRYQEKVFGELQYGKFFENVGFFDCGLWTYGDSTDCPACARPDIFVVGKYHCCRACNAGFREEAM